MTSKITLLVSYVALFLVCLACGDSQGEPDASLDTKIDSTTIYGVVTYDFPSLSTAAQTQTAQWSVYSDFERYAKSLNGKTIEELQGRTERLITFTDSLSKKLPDSLDTKGIYSRLTLVRTRVGMLYQDVHKIPPDSLDIEKSLSEMNLAVTNMIIQINEKFEKDAINLQRKEDEEKELEKQRKFLDSVRDAELEDQRRSDGQ